MKYLYSILSILSAVVLVPAVIMLGWVPEEQSMGTVQKIFYLHVPMAAWCFLSVGIMAVGSVGYLVRHGRGWDRLAEAAGQVALIYCTVVLLTGSIWARSAWGVWWTWDPRLTTSLVLWCLLVVYGLLRGTVDDRHLRGRVCAVFGLLAAIDVPIVYMTTRWWQSIHPPAGMAMDAESVARPMMLTLMVWMLAVGLWCVALILLRWRLLALQDRLEAATDTVMAVVERDGQGGVEPGSWAQQQGRGDE